MYAEYYSNHPIAKAIIRYEKPKIDSNLLKDYKEIEGKGVYVVYKDKVLLAGNEKLLDEYKINYSKNNTVFTKIYVAYDGEFKGTLEIKDEIKETSKIAIANFHKNGVQNVIMLTGDNDKIANEVAKEVGVDKVYASLLPLDKVNKLEEIKKTGTTLFIGDGVNDAPSLSLADIGVAMGGIGSDITIESSDAVIMDDDLNKVNEVIYTSKSNQKVVYENIIFALIIKIGTMILSLIPNLPIEPYIMWFAIFADVGVTIICVINSLRLLKLKNKAK